jgi:hypothetical protein
MSIEVYGVVRSDAFDTLTMRSERKKSLETEESSKHLSLLGETHISENIFGPLFLSNVRGEDGLRIYYSAAVSG